jgi:ribonuclease HI
MSQKLIIYTDGACKGNPGIGGWGALLIYGPHSKEFSGYVAHTTNNRMELTAVIQALKAVKRHCSIILFSDSQYVIRGMQEWLPAWQQRNWKNLKNPDLWQELSGLAKPHDIEWRWVRGHNGDIYNERADELAKQAIIQALNS